MTQRPRLVVGMSGSSAPHYGIALLETLHAVGSVKTHLVLSDGARRTIQLEADLDPELVCHLADVVHHANNLRPICDFTIGRIQHALGNHGPELPVTIAPRQWLM